MTLFPRPLNACRLQQGARKSTINGSISVNVWLAGAFRITLSLNVWEALFECSVSQPSLLHRVSESIKRGESAIKHVKCPLEGSCFQFPQMSGAFLGAALALNYVISGDVLQPQLDTL